jgi:[ribosomal protein S5]-alanine N-acetyltransferase
MEIQTSRLIIRPRRISDIDDLLEINHDEEILKYNCSPKFTYEQLATVLKKQVNEPGHWCLELQTTHKVIGNIDLDRDNLRYFVNSKIISYELLTPYVGQGLMFEAMTALLKHYFEQEQIRIITARVFSDNEKSQKLLRRLGFQQEGYLREAVVGYGNVVHDDVLFCLINEQQPKVIDAYLNS